MPKPFKTTPADLVKCREELNLSRKELAEEFGVTVRTISRWETGQTSFNRMTVLAYLYLLGKRPSA